jgi:histidine ammonia-lyase
MSVSSPAPALVIDGGTLDLAGLEAVARDSREVVLSEAAREAVRASRRVVDAAVARGDVVYGVTTGFGSFADVHIPTTACASCR